MELNSVLKDYYAIVTIKGRLDSLTADNFQTYISKLLSVGTVFIIVDGKELQFLSSAGLRAILICFKEIEKLSGRLIFTSLTAPIIEIIELSGLGKYIESFASLEKAEHAMHHIQRPI